AQRRDFLRGSRRREEQRVLRTACVLCALDEVVSCALDEVVSFDEFGRPAPPPLTVEEWRLRLPLPQPPPAAEPEAKRTAERSGESSSAESEETQRPSIVAWDSAGPCLVVDNGLLGQWRPADGLPLGERLRRALGYLRPCDMPAGLRRTIPTPSPGWIVEMAMARRPQWQWALRVLDEAFERSLVDAVLDAVLDELIERSLVDARRARSRGAGSTARRAERRGAHAPPAWRAAAAAAAPPRVRYDWAGDARRRADELWAAGDYERAELGYVEARQWLEAFDHANWVWDSVWRAARLQ
ncbi:hypothetical protein OAO87_04255, partial [bacterium]|nr:hypothetical protein [bacterium]